MAVQFPVQAYALKRQVFLMSFATDPLSTFKLFLLYLSQFHPFFQLKYRFDPAVSRLDRFLFCYLQISILALACFLSLRKVDEPDLNTGEFVFRSEVLVMPAILSVAFSFLLLSPLPSRLLSLFEIKYVMQEIPEDINEDEESDEKAEVADPDDKVFVDPNLPLKYLF